MDEWVTRDRIKMTEEPIVEEAHPKKRPRPSDKREVMVENDEHEGMDHQSLITHE